MLAQPAEKMPPVAEPESSEQAPVPTACSAQGLLEESSLELVQAQDREREPEDARWKVPEWWWDELLLLLQP